MITGRTRVIAHLGYPTESFKAPMIYNPWFEMKGIEAVVVPIAFEAVTLQLTLRRLRALPTASLGLLSRFLVVPFTHHP